MQALPGIVSHMSGGMGGTRVNNVQRFRGGLVFKAHRRLYHSTLGLTVMKKKKKTVSVALTGVNGGGGHGFWSRQATRYTPLVRR